MQNEDLQLISELIIGGVIAITLVGLAIILLGMIIGVGFKFTKARLTKKTLPKYQYEVKRPLSKRPSTTNRNICAFCGKTVSEKVKQYCLSNRQRFNGKVYCFEHQKRIVNSDHI